MDIVSYLKNATGILATVTTLAYVSGYLTLRARAFALGTDPALALVYEGYVFAGFRFVFISLIHLLVLSPLILAVRSGASWMCKRIHHGALLSTGQWLLLFLLALCTLFITIKILGVNGVLLQQKSNGSNSLLKKAVEEAVMGGQIALVLMFAVLFLTALSVLWLKACLSAGNNSFTWLLSIVVAIQVFLLPILNGALYADRKVRVLAATPDAVKWLKEPLGIVDRTSNHATLLGLDENNEPRLVTIELGELNGVPVKSIVRLKEFVENDLGTHAEGKGELSMPDKTRGELFMPDKTHQKKETSSHETDGEKGFFKLLIDHLHVAFENIGSLGDSVVDCGQVWSVELDASGKPSKPRRISTAGNLAWPVLGSKGLTVFAIQEGRIVQLSDDGQLLTEVNNQEQWARLFGVTEHGDVLGMIYEDDESKLAILHADGTVTLSPVTWSEEEQKRKSILGQENRSYSGNRSLYVERSTLGRRGFDVFFKTGEEIFNLSECGDDRCGQPSLSPDFRRVLYVRKSRY